MGKLDGRIAVVTGAASGMGSAQARLLAGEGAKVALCDINVSAGEALATELGGKFYPLDVTDEVQWSVTLNAILEDWGPVTILVNNAGVGHNGAVQDTSTNAWNSVLAVNLTGPFLGIRTVVPHMESAGGGVIVNVSSAAAMSPFPNTAAYTSSKWGVRGLTKSAALDLAPFGIRVLSLHPALVRTPMSEGMDLAAATANYPIARPGEAEELARMVLFMVAEATYSTGCEFIADGGSLL